MIKVIQEKCNKCKVHYSHLEYKGKYLMNRYTELRNEMNVRGFKPDPDRIFNSDIFIDNNLYNDWTPTITDYKIIRKRIEERITKKPDWYRKTERTT